MIKEIIIVSRDINDKKGIYMPCPDCKNETVNQGGCETCMNCGWSKCSIA